jgi:hypothetical protein
MPVPAPLPEPSLLPPSGDPDPKSAITKESGSGAATVLLIKTCNNIEKKIEIKSNLNQISNILLPV